MGRRSFLYPYWSVGRVWEWIFRMGYSTLVRASGFSTISRFGAVPPPLAGLARWIAIFLARRLFIGAIGHLRSN